MSVAQAAAHDAGFDLGPEPAIAPARPVSSAERLEIVGELLLALDQATGPAQAHLMRRTLGIVRQEVLWTGLRLTGWRHAMAVATMGDLDREVVRLAPDLEEFRRRTSGLIDLLSAAPKTAENGREMGVPRS
jgi:hypothetical protein